jgi:hypothetical protein
MIKADSFIKLDGTTTQEQANWLLQVTANVTIFADFEKTREVCKKTYTFSDISLENATLQYVYGRVSMEFQNPTLV